MSSKHTKMMQFLKKKKSRGIHFKLQNNQTAIKTFKDLASLCPPKVFLNLQPSCLHFLSARIIDVCHSSGFKSSSERGGENRRNNLQPNIVYNHFEEV